MQATTARRIGAAVLTAKLPEARARLSTAFLDRMVDARMTEYRGWLAGRIGMLGFMLWRRDLAADEAALRDPTAVSGGGYSEPCNAQGEATWAVVQALDRIKGARDRLETLGREMQKRWGSGAEMHQRFFLALVRIAAPLTEAEGSGGVELSVEELHTCGRLEPYVKHACAAQLALLPPQRFMERVRGRTRARGEEVAMTVEGCV